MSGAQRRLEVGCLMTSGAQRRLKAETTMQLQGLQQVAMCQTVHPPNTLPAGSSMATAQQRHCQPALLCSFLHVSAYTLCCLQGLRGSQHSCSAPAGGEQRLRSRQPPPARARQGRRPALLRKRTQPQVGSLMLGHKPQTATGNSVLHQRAAHKVCLDRRCKL